MLQVCQRIWVIPMVLNMLTATRRSQPDSSGHASCQSQTELPWVSYISSSPLCQFSVGFLYGKLSHIVFLCFVFVTNIVVASQLLLGRSAVVNALTGVNVYVAVILTPLR